MLLCFYNEGIKALPDLQPTNHQEVFAVMFERERKLYSFLLEYCGDLVADIDDARFAEQPSPGINTPAWILGHLSIATDFALRLLGESLVLSKEWHRLFGPGSTVVTERSMYPSKTELLAALASGHARVVEALDRVEPNRLLQPQPTKFLREELPTIGDMLAHLMTTHEATHLGQLSMWRRLIGLPGVLG